MALKDKLAASAAKEVVVTVKMEGGAEKIRLKYPSHGDVMEWTKESEKNDKAIQSGNTPAMAGHLKGAMLTLRKTLVVDDGQPMLDDDELAELIRQAGGVLVDDSDSLVAKARDMMLDKAALDPEKLKELTEKEAAKRELPFESPDSTG